MSDREEDHGGDGEEAVDVDKAEGEESAADAEAPIKDVDPEDMDVDVECDQEGDVDIKEKRDSHEKSVVASSVSSHSVLADGKDGGGMQEEGEKLVVEAEMEVLEEKAVPGLVAEARDDGTEDEAEGDEKNCGGIESAEVKESSEDDEAEEESHVKDDDEEEDAEGAIEEVDAGPAKEGRDEEIQAVDGSARARQSGKKGGDVEDAGDGDMELSESEDDTAAKGEKTSEHLRTAAADGDGGKIADSADGHRASARSGGSGANDSNGEDGGDGDKGSVSSVFKVQQRSESTKEEGRLSPVLAAAAGDGAAERESKTDAECKDDSAELSTQALPGGAASGAIRSSEPSGKADCTDSKTEGEPTKGDSIGTGGSSAAAAASGGGKEGADDADADADMDGDKAAAGESAAGAAAGGDGEGDSEGEGAAADGKDADAQGADSDSAMDGGAAAPADAGDTPTPAAAGRAPPPRVGHRWASARH
jgi:hypothetical protein